MPPKKPVTTKRGQHHKFKSFIMNLVKDNNIMKVDANIVRKNPKLFDKKKVTFEKRNDDPAHFRDAIYEQFPSLSEGEFSLWRLKLNDTTFIPLPSNITNAAALCNYEELKRSHLYIRLMAAPTKVPQDVPVKSDFSESGMNSTVANYPGDEDDSDDDGDAQMTVQNFTQQTVSVDNYAMVTPLTGNGSNAFTPFTLSFVQTMGPNGEMLLQPQNPVQNLIMIDQQEPYSSFQVNKNYGDTGTPDQSFKANSDFRIDAIMTSQNDKKRKNFSDSEDQNAKLKFWNARLEGSAHESGVSEEFKRLDAARTMTSLQLLDQFHGTTCTALTQDFTPSTGHSDMEYNDYLKQLMLSSGAIPFASSYLQSLPLTSIPQEVINFYNDLKDDMCIEDDMEIIEVPRADHVGGIKCQHGNIFDLTVLNGNLYVIYEDSEIISVHSSQSPFQEIKTFEVKGMKRPREICASSRKNCLYILDEGEIDSTDCIWIVMDSVEFISRKLIEDVNCRSLSVTADGDLVILDNKNCCLHLYKSENGHCSRCVHLPDIFQKEFTDLARVICSQDNGFFIALYNDESKRSLIAKVSEEGKILKTFGGRSGSGSGQLAFRDVPSFLTIDKYGRVIAFDSENRRVLLLNSTLDSIWILLDTEDFPVMCLFGICCFDTDCLFLNSEEDKIEAYSLEQFKPERLKKIMHQKSLQADKSMDEVHLLGSIFTEDTIRGVALLLDKIYIITSKSLLIHSGQNPYKQIYKEDTGTNEDVDFWDIAASDSSIGRLYVTDKSNRCVYSMDIDIRRTKWLQNIGSPYTLSVSKDGSVIIPNNEQQGIDIYQVETDQQQQRIELASYLKGRKLRHAIKLQDIYVVSIGSPGEDFDDVNNEVFLVSSNGHIIKSYKDETVPKLNLPNHLSIARGGNVLLADGKNKRVLRLDDQLQLKETLLSDDVQGIDEPQRLSYDQRSDRLLVSCSYLVDIFSLHFSNQKPTEDYDSLSLPAFKTSDSDHDDFSFDLPDFQRIDGMDDQMLKCDICRGVAVLYDRLYLISTSGCSVYVHRGDHPFDLIEEIEITDKYLLQEIKASSAHGCCYIRGYSKIWRLLMDSKRAEIFLESEVSIRSISVTAEGQLFVVYYDGRLASYNSDRECTGCIFPNDHGGSINCSVKTGKDKIIYITANDDLSLLSLYENHVNDSDSCCYGPFTWLYCGYSFHGITLGEDGQLFVLDDSYQRKVLLYDYKAHLLRTLLTNAEHQMSEVFGLCYWKEKKQLLVCGGEGIVFFQLSQSEQIGQSCGRLQSLHEKNLSKDKSIEEANSRLLCTVKLNRSRGKARGIARLECKTYFLCSSELWSINSKDIRTKGFGDQSHTLKIPKDQSNLKKGGLWDMAASHFDQCLYITDKKNNCVWSVTVDHKIKKWLDYKDSSYTLSVTSDGCVCILSNHYKHLYVYDSNGILKKSIRMPPSIIDLCHSVQTLSGNYVICGNKNNLDDDNKNDDEDDDSDDDGENDNEGDDSDNDGISDDYNEHDKEKKHINQLKENNSEDFGAAFLHEISPEGVLISTRPAPVNRLKSAPVKSHCLAIDPNNGKIFLSGCKLGKNGVLLFDSQLELLENVTKELEDNELFTEYEMFPRALCYDSYAKELLVLSKYNLDGNFYLFCLRV